MRYAGSQACFDLAAEYLGGFSAPQALVVGNHDLEGGEFETDEDNLAAWLAVFKHRHYWAAKVGPMVVVGISTTRFRSNEFRSGFPRVLGCHNFRVSVGGVLVMPGGLVN